MSFGTALIFPFRDSQWLKKLIVPGLLGLIPLLGPIFPMGYALSVAWNIINKRSGDLPVFDFGREFKRGVMILVIGLGYFLPIILVFLILSMALVIYGVLFNQFGNADSSATGIVILQGCFGVLAMGYGLFVVFFAPAALANFLAKGEHLGEAFRFEVIWRSLKKAFPQYLLLVPGVFLVNLLAASGSVLCVLGLIISVPYAMTVYGHLIGQAYNASRVS
jgi:hypothetical protein